MNVPKRGQTAAATLNPALIKRMVDRFPHGRGWKTFQARELLRATAPETARRPLAWGTVSKALGSSAGIYVFLFSKRLFADAFSFDLHGPSSQHKPRRIRFQATTSTLPSPIRGNFAAYVGRSANLGDRLRLHFHATKNTTSAQVRKALEACRNLKPHAAIDFMLNHATVAYCTIPGDKNVANRDIIEVALWAKYRTPFNIKSER
jgi:hypothetical protein